MCSANSSKGLASYTPEECFVASFSWLCLSHLTRQAHPLLPCGCPKLVRHDASPSGASKAPSPGPYLVPANEALAGQLTWRSKRRAFTISQFGFITQEWIWWSDNSLVAGCSDALFTIGPSASPSGSFGGIGSEGDSQSGRTWPMPFGIREHSWLDLRFPHLLRSGSYIWQTMPFRLDEYWRWLLQEKERASWNLLVTTEWTMRFFYANKH